MSVCTVNAGCGFLKKLFQKRVGEDHHQDGRVYRHCMMVGLHPDLGYQVTLELWRGWGTEEPEQNGFPVDIDVMDKTRITLTKVPHPCLSSGIRRREIRERLQDRFSMTPGLTSVIYRDDVDYVRVVESTIQTALGVILTDSFFRLR